MIGSSTSWNCGHAEVELGLEGGEADQQAAHREDAPVASDRGDRAVGDGHRSAVSTWLAAALDDQDRAADQGEAGAADQHQVGRAPEGHVLAEDPVPDVVEREADQREAGGGEHRDAAERRVPVAGDPDRARARLALGEDDRQEAGGEDPEQARRGSGSGPGWRAGPGRGRRRCAGRCPSTCRAARRAASRRRSATGSAAQGAKPGVARGEVRRSGAAGRCGRCGAPSRGRARTAVASIAAAGGADHLAERRAASGGVVDRVHRRLSFTPGTMSFRHVTPCDVQGYASCRSAAARGTTTNLPRDVREGPGREPG